MLSEEVLEQIAGGFDTNSPMFKVGVGIVAGLFGLTCGVGIGFGYHKWSKGKTEKKLKTEQETLRKLRNAIARLQLQPIISSVEEKTIKELNIQLNAIGVVGSYERSNISDSWMFESSKE